MIFARASAYKLTWRPKLRDRHEFYDLKLDPNELLSLQGPVPEVESQLMQTLHEDMDFSRNTQVTGELGGPDEDAVLRARLEAMGYIEASTVTKV